MHVYINLKPENPLAGIPIQYNHLVQSAIYASLPQNMADWLHDEGYTAGKRNYKLFTFSRLSGKYIINKDSGVIAFPEGARLVVTSPDVEFLQGLVNDLLKRGDFRVGDLRFQVDGIECARQVVNDDLLTVRTLSPVVAYSTLLRPEGGKYTCYYQPGEGEFDKLITTNLAKKYESFYGRRVVVGEVRVRPLDRPRLHVTSYKGTVVKGYTCHLKLHGPRELLQMALDAGLGSKGSQGYGCVEKRMSREMRQ